MSGDVKRKRPYRSERRREQAEQTRGRILDAAAELFVAGGFAGTSVAAIAGRAGVSAETVYQAFGSKPALLDALVRRAARARRARRRSPSRPGLSRSRPSATSASRCGCSRPTSSAGWSGSGR